MVRLSIGLYKNDLLCVLFRGGNKLPYKLIFNIHAFIHTHVDSSQCLGHPVWVCLNDCLAVHYPMNCTSVSTSVWLNGK